MFISYFVCVLFDIRAAVCVTHDVCVSEEEEAREGCGHPPLLYCLEVVPLAEPEACCFGYLGHQTIQIYPCLPFSAGVPGTCICARLLHGW